LGFEGQVPFDSPHPNLPHMYEETRIPTPEVMKRLGAINPAELARNFASRVNVGVQNPFDFIPQALQGPLAERMAPELTRWLYPNRDLGQGADAGPTRQLMGGAAQQPLTGWTPPVPPQEVVGTGNRFGQPVDMEGIHKGLDFQAVRGTPALAPANGTVVGIENKPEGLGLQVLIKDDTGQVHTLSHLDSVEVREGDQVRAGQPVGAVGSSGEGSTGPHLDYRVQGNQGEYRNPEPLAGPLAQLPTVTEAPPGRTGTGADEPSKGWLDEFRQALEYMMTQRSKSSDLKGYLGGGLQDLVSNEPMTGYVAEHMPSDFTYRKPDDPRSPWPVSGPEAHGNDAVTKTWKRWFDPSSAAAGIADRLNVGIVNPFDFIPERFQGPLLERMAPELRGMYPQEVGKGQGGLTPDYDAEDEQGADAWGTNPSDVATPYHGWGGAGQIVSDYGGPAPSYNAPSPGGLLNYDPRALLNSTMAPNQTPGANLLGYDPWALLNSTKVPNQPPAGYPGGPSPAAPAFSTPPPAGAMNEYDPGAKHNVNSAPQQGPTSMAPTGYLAGPTQAEMQQAQYQKDQLDLQRQQLAQSYQLQMKQLEQQWMVHQDDNALQRQQLQLENEWRAADRALEAQQRDLDRQMQLKIQGSFNDKAQLQLYDTAWRNPWVQQLTGMAPAWKTPGGPGMPKITPTPITFGEGQDVGRGGEQVGWGADPAPLVNGAPAGSTPSGWNPNQAANSAYGANSPYGAAPKAPDTTVLTPAQPTGTGPTSLGASGSSSAYNAFPNLFQTNLPAATTNLNTPPQSTTSDWLTSGPPAPSGIDPSMWTAFRQMGWGGYTPTMGDTNPTLYQDNDYLRYLLNMGEIGQTLPQSAKDPLLNWLNGMNGGGGASAALGMIPNFKWGGSTDPNGGGGTGNGLESDGLPAAIPWERYQGMTPFERAALRTRLESQGIPWEQYVDKLRTSWGTAGGPTAAPGMTALSAARQTPRDYLGNTQIAETFGQSPEEYWTQQKLGWSPAGATAVSLIA
jgi:murein DD-endopeptidase MepM/ murein hydrolase activator NlpD